MGTVRMGTVSNIVLLIIPISILYFLFSQALPLDIIRALACDVLFD
jgi:hypothetical protein